MDINKFKDVYECVRVIENNNTVTDKPTVSVCVQTYQHVNYIKQCLDNILEQKVNFDFEILIGEDASKDGTREICIEYAIKYPEKIRLFLHHRENNIEIDGQSTGRFNFFYNLCLANGKYIALCEGDDYWADPLKLQKQVAILEAHNDVSLVFSNRFVLDMKSHSKTKHILPSNKNRYTLNDVIAGFVPSTQTVLFRRDENLIGFFERHIKHPSGDQVIALFYTLKGNLYLLQDLTAVYRITGQGLWSSRRNNLEHSIKLFLNSFKQVLIKENIYRPFYFNAGAGRKILGAKSLKAIVKLDIGKSVFYKLYCVFIFRLHRLSELIYQRK